MFLQSLELENVRSLEHAQLSFAASDTQNRKWTVILGENGCGKSTVLKSIALLMAGSEALAELLGSPAAWIRNGRNSCLMRARLLTADGEPRTLELSLRRKDTLREVFIRNQSALESLDRALRHAGRNYLTVGYGVSRRFSSNKFAAGSGETFLKPRAQSVATMFSADATLQPLEAWATDLHYRKGAAGLKVISDTLAGLLPEVRFKRIDRSRRQLLFDTPDGIVPLDALSDGYQNVAAWCGDLVYRITEQYANYRRPLEVRGLLLVDEIDLHLHPVWQRQLRSYLDSKLPNLQIVATTHSALTAQQTGPGELYFLKRGNGAAELEAYTGDPDKLMVHQLLMARPFGLDTMDSARVERLRSEYRELRSRSSISKLDRARIEALRRELEDIPDWSTGSAADRSELALLRDIRKALKR